MTKFSLLQIFQGTALSLILRFSRTGSGQPYLASVAVIWTELIKLLICIVAELWVCQRTAREKSVTYLQEVQNDLHDIISTSVPMVVPAGLFVMQQVCDLDTRPAPLPVGGISNDARSSCCPAHNNIVQCDQMLPLRCTEHI